MTGSGTSTAQRSRHVLVLVLAGAAALALLTASRMPWQLSTPPSDVDSGPWTVPAWLISPWWPGVVVLGVTSAALLASGRPRAGAVMACGAGAMLVSDLLRITVGSADVGERAWGPQELVDLMTAVPGVGAWWAPGVLALLAAAVLAVPPLIRRASRVHLLPGGVALGMAAWLLLRVPDSTAPRWTTDAGGPQDGTGFGWFVYAPQAQLRVSIFQATEPPRPLPGSGLLLALAATSTLVVVGVALARRTRRPADPIDDGDGLSSTAAADGQRAHGPLGSAVLVLLGCTLAAVAGRELLGPGWFGIDGTDDAWRVAAWPTLAVGLSVLAAVACVVAVQLGSVSRDVAATLVGLPLAAALVVVLDSMARLDVAAPEYPWSPPLATVAVLLAQGLLAGRLLRVQRTKP